MAAMFYSGVVECMKQTLFVIPFLIPLRPYPFVIPYNICLLTIFIIPFIIPFFIPASV